MELLKLFLLPVKVVGLSRREKKLTIFGRVFRKFLWPNKEKY